KPGQEAEVTANVKGGQGVVGVFLVDTDLRFQARPLQGDGWVIVGSPKIWGGDGKEQTKWLDSRAPGLHKNLNSAIIFDQKSDIAGALLLGTLFLTALAAKERDNRFCVSCHLHDEKFLRLTASEATDLAGFHHRKKADVGCIACHGGADPLMRAKVWTVAGFD